MPASVSRAHGKKRFGGRRIIFGGGSVKLSITVLWPGGGRELELGSGGDSDGGLGKGKDSKKVSGRYFGNEGVTDRGWGRAREW